MKKVLVILLLLVMCFADATNVYAADRLCDFEDETLKEFMSIYDVNGDGMVYRSEYQGIAGGRDVLILDDVKISSVKGLEALATIWELHMKNCGYSSLPGEMENLDVYKLFLNDNNLESTEELIPLLNQQSSTKKYIYLSGNPCFDEVVEWDFNKRFYNLSIVGSVGETYWQKSNERSYLRVDYMASGIIEDAVWEDKVIGEADFLDMEWEFSIEDETIAKIEGEGFIERDFVYDPFRYVYTSDHILEEYRNQKDTVINVKLLKEGKTRMKIKCGDYVKYTDIIVFPEHVEYSGTYTMPYISDIGLIKLVNTYIASAYSGVYMEAYDYFNKEESIINGNVAFVKDFGSFSDMNEIRKLTLQYYTADMLEDVINIENIPNLACLKVFSSEKTEQSSEELYKCLDERICEAKGNGWATVMYDGYVEAKNVDINCDGNINAKDALDILKHVADYAELSEEQRYIANLNNDNSINAKDALFVLEIAAGIR